MCILHCWALVKWLLNWQMSLIERWSLHVRNYLSSSNSRTSNHNWCSDSLQLVLYFWVSIENISTFKEQASIHSRISTKCSNTAWKHKVPQRRSAFTYWEEDIPPRIDLGKNKYGGPFTNEEVEDTKTFLRILPLLLCLFGYHLAGDGYSAPQHLHENQLSFTTSTATGSYLIHSTSSGLVAVLGIPLYRLVIIKLVPWAQTHVLCSQECGWDCTFHYCKCYMCTL